MFIVCFLHQTTTIFNASSRLLSCLSSVSYIKPQPARGCDAAPTRCLSSVSYIKPQLSCFRWRCCRCCLSSVSYIKPQQSRISLLCCEGCLSSVSYIKPQPSGRWTAPARVVYRLFPTSNHNNLAYYLRLCRLFIVCFLHQTTTSIGVLCLTSRCLSSVSYIKPQPTIVPPANISVVYRLFPTSNHNGVIELQHLLIVVYRLFPTSNHNKN